MGLLNWYKEWREARRKKRQRAREEVLGAYGCYTHHLESLREIKGKEILTGKFTRVTAGKEPLKIVRPGKEDVVIPPYQSFVSQSEDE